VTISPAHLPIIAPDVRDENRGRLIELPDFSDTLKKEIRIFCDQQKLFRLFGGFITRDGNRPRLML
jgi:hypothetical protein